MVSMEPPADFKKRFDVAGCFMQYDGKFVLLRRQLEKRNGGQWGLPAGKAEEGEALEQAVMREVKEETGVLLSLSQAKYFSSLYVRDGDLDLIWHMFSADLVSQPSIVLEPKEHSEFRWVTPQEAMQMEDLIHGLKESIVLFYNLS